MTNRQLSYIVKNQKPLVLGADETVQAACREMRKLGTGSTLVVDHKGLLCGIFTGRDAVRLLAKGGAADTTSLAAAMTRNPVVVEPTCLACDALRAMIEGEFRHLPVTVEGRIFGVVSHRDFKGMEMEELLRHAADRPSHSTRHREIREIIENQKPLVLKGDKTVSEAARSMRRRKCGAALIVDDQRHLKGIFTGRDAVRVLASGKDPAAMRLADAMTKNPLSTTPNRQAIDALRIMNDGGFRHLPVVDDGKILGIVSRADFTGIEIDRLDEEEHLKECIW